MRSSTLALLFLISIQAAVNPGGDARAHGNTRQEVSVNAAMLRHVSRPSEAGRQHPNSQPIPIVDPKLFNRRRHRSPRVLFSALPPNTEVAPRVRRRAGKPMHRGEYSVCDSISDWVGNKTRATDMSGNEVTVLPNFNVGNTVLQQYFFETTCHGGGGGGYSSGSSTGASSGSSRARSSGCRGIDSRHWNSYCSNTHTYVRALTSFNSQVGWKYIRINTACVCVLSRKSWKH